MGDAEIQAVFAKAEAAGYSSGLAFVNEMNLWDATRDEVLAILEAPVQG